ncbi:MAG: FAD-dependent oxidoreductase [Dehalococcoidia bacterium]|nr:FAD-dependent oxidoreductase [Dehalococcoidia bacterium]
MPVDYLIIGGGRAGDTAAATLRRMGAKGRGIIVSREQEYPYFRYALTKEFIQGKRQRARMFLHPPKFYDDQGIEMKIGATAVSLDTGRRTVTLESGEEISFEKLLLATGASPRKMLVPGSELPGVYYLRTLADAEAIRQEIAPGQKAVIVGGGFIGAELAASLTQDGVETTIIDTSQTIWANLFGQAIGRFSHEALQERGVTVLAPAHVQGIEGDGKAQRVVTQEGQVAPSDFVIIGIGAVPETGLAQAAGLKVDNGIVVNEYLETSEPGIFAAGDSASFFSPLYGAQMRIEHWDVAYQHGVTAAQNMLGQSKAFDQVPSFFSGMFDIWLDFLGHAPKWDQLDIRKFDQGRFSAFYSQPPHIKGALLVNNGQELQKCKELIRRQVAIGDFGRLRDTSVDLASYVTP